MGIPPPFPENANRESAARGFYDLIFTAFRHFQVRGGFIVVHGEPPQMATKARQRLDICQPTQVRSHVAIMLDAVPGSLSHYLFRYPRAGG
jgi:hypothetical protein